MANVTFKASTRQADAEVKREQLIPGEEDGRLAGETPVGALGGPQSFAGWNRPDDPGTGAENLREGGEKQFDDAGKHDSGDYRNTK